MAEGFIQSKARDFAIRIIGCYKYLCEEKSEYVMSKQLLRCGTSIGANAHEAINAQSKADFINKYSISLKEADETTYWLDILQATGYLDKSQFESLNSDCIELIKLLTSAIKKLKQ
jgi:four helix bundle protein